jgi:hypothetical protein
MNHFHPEKKDPKMTRTSKRTTRPGLEDLEGRRLLSTAAVPTTAPLPVAAHVAPASVAAPAPANTTSRVTLTITSMLAPGVTTFNGKTALAWTGTDLGHHLSVGLVNTGTSLATLPNFAVTTLPEQSNQSPAAAVYGNRLYLAWTGLDGRLNMESSADGVHFGNKVTFNTFSGSSPALDTFNGRLYIAWTGFDGRINLASSPDGVRFDRAETFAQTSFKPVVIAKINTQAEMAPALASFDGRLWIAWTGSDPQHHLNTMSSADGINFSQVTTYVATSEDAPALVVQPGTSPNQPARLVLGWTGVGNKLLNVMSTTVNAPGFFNPTALPQTANNGIALYATVPGKLGIAWAGTDIQYHINLLQM